MKDNSKGAGEMKTKSSPKPGDSRKSTDYVARNPGSLRTERLE